MRLTTENGYDMFEVSSALQKEIRRGNEEHALYWARELESKFAGQLWKRLTVIAIEDIGLADPTVTVVVNSLRQQYDYLAGKPGNSRMMPVTMAVLLMARSQKSRIVDHANIACRERVRQDGVKLEIPDYALDKHTMRGKRMGRGFDHFLTVGDHLENKAALDDPWYADYLRLARTQQPLPKAAPRSCGKAGKADEGQFEFEDDDSQGGSEGGSRAGGLF